MANYAKHWANLVPAILLMFCFYANLLCKSKFNEHFIFKIFYRYERRRILFFTVDHDPFDGAEQLIVSRTTNNKFLVNLDKRKNLYK